MNFEESSIFFWVYAHLIRILGMYVYQFTNNYDYRRMSNMNMNMNQNVFQGSNDGVGSVSGG